MLINPRDLTLGERLMIGRRREGLTQTEAAKKHNVTLYKYRQWEEDDMRGKGTAPFIRLGPLKKNEQCLVRRRREGLRAAQVAEHMKISEFWLRRMERGNSPVRALYNYWQKY